MSEAEIPQVDPVVDAVVNEEEPIIHPKATPIESRFLYVDVAALRAKQLRRGARPRLDQAEEHPLPLIKAVKAERVAMEEVKRGLVFYDVPVKPPAGEAEV
jgi:DNA-directed RNA polymerase subunit K/omega